MKKERKKMSHDHHEGCGCGQRSVPLAQSIEEVQFERSIQSAAAIGNVTRVKEICERSPGHAVSQDTYGYTALHYAAKTGDVVMCQFLLSIKGYPLNAVTRSSGTTALHRAAMAGHDGVVSMLLGCGADANVVDSEGRTAYDKAVVAGHVHVAQLLK